MEWERQKTYLYNKGKEDGVAEGKIEAKIETARNFLAEGVAPEIIAKCSGLSLDEVHKLAEELSPANV